MIFFIARGVYLRIFKFVSRKMIPTSELLNSVFMSLWFCRISATLACSSLLTAASSSLTDCSSSFEVCSSSLVLCSSSLALCSCSLALRSSSLAWPSSAMVARRLSR